MIRLHQNSFSPPSDTDPLRHSRSAAQREASRRNGQKSCGPITDKGKAFSRRNATRHGLLAKHLMPALDSRDFDELYRRTRKALANQFSPEVFTDRALVDTLAADYVQLARAHRLIEAACMPQATDGNTLREQRRSKNLLHQIERFLAGQPIGKARDCRRLAERVASLVERIRHEATGDEFENDPAKLDGDERQELLDALQRWKRLRPSYRKLKDVQHVAAVLVGEVQPSRVEKSRLQTLLSEIAADLRRRIATAAAQRLRQDQVLASAEAALAAAPEKLALLQRYATSIERRIERKVKQLAGAPGSFRKNR